MSGATQLEWILDSCQQSKYRAIPVCVSKATSLRFFHFLKVPFHSTEESHEELSSLQIGTVAAVLRTIRNMRVGAHSYQHYTALVRGLVES